MSEGPEIGGVGNEEVALDDFAIALAPPTPSSGVRGTVLGVDSGANDGSSTLLQISSETAAGTAIGETGFMVTDIAVTPDGRIFQYNT